MNQEWLCSDNGSDLCSHGQFELIIDGHNIIDRKEDPEWTLSTSLLFLLRTIESDHISEHDFELITHCGGIIMLGCPIGIYLDLKHKDGLISIDNIRKQYGVNSEDVKLYANLSVEFPKRDYAIMILNEAKKVKTFFETEIKRKVDNNYIAFWNEFWSEFNELYDNAYNKYCC